MAAATKRVAAQKPAKPKPKPKPKAAPARKSAAKSTAKASSAIDALYDRFCEAPDDVELLKVYADALAEAGDPRGTHIHLCLAKSEDAIAFRKRYHPAILGPAKGLFRDLTFADNGLVTYARTEFDKVVANIDGLGRINPRLMLEITSVRSLAHAQQLGAISLAPIFLVDFGSTPLDDKKLAAIAPALADVQCLVLPCAALSPDGLRALGKRMRKLAYLAISVVRAKSPPIDYARAIADSFPTLRAVCVMGTAFAPLGLTIPEGPRPSRFGDTAGEIARAIAT